MTTLAILNARLLDPATGAEAARFGIAQRLRFTDQLVTLPGAAPVSERLSDLLLGQFGLPTEALFRVKGPVNLVRQSQLVVNSWPQKPTSGPHLMASLMPRALDRGNQNTEKP